MVQIRSYLMGKLGKKAKTKLLADVCLHCLFFQAHSDKWSGWSPNTAEKDSSTPAFNDLVRTGIKIVAEIFTMLDEKGRMQFFEKVEENVKQHEVIDSLKTGKAITMKELLERLGVVTDNKPDVKH